MTIGQTIRRIREEKGYNRRMLAEESGISYTSLDNWEHGKSFPNVINLITVADVLGVTLDALVGRELGNTQKCC